MKRTLLLTAVMLSSCTSEEKLANDTYQSNPNLDSPVSPPDTADTSDTPDTDTPDTSDGSNWDAVSQGDLIITEVQNNPCVLGDDADGDGNLDCLLADELGEWFEVYNNSSLDLDLNGLIVRDDDSNNPQQFTISQSTPVLSGEYVVFHVNGDANTNGGVSPVVTYNGGDSGFALSNSNDEIIIEKPDGTIIDQLFYNDSEFPDTKGYSMNLDPNQMDASANDNATNWCLAISTYGDGDFGTPGGPNEACQ